MANNEINTVTLSVSSYNSVKNDVFRYNLFLDNLLQEAMLSEDHQSLVFDSKKSRKQSSSAISSGIRRSWQR